eukprot:g6994.t1
MRSSSTSLLLLLASTLLAGSHAASCSYKDQTTCDGDSGCTWCKCAALPSQCWTKSDAAKLPAGVYVCDNAAAAAKAAPAPASSAPPLRSSPSCNTFTDCNSCTSAPTWVPGSSCRWCTKDQQCHAEGSVMDPCSNSEIIFKPDQCNTQPTPVPMPTPAPAPAPSSATAAKIVEALFKLLKIDDVDAQACVDDVGGAGVALKDFAQDVKAKQYSEAVVELGRGVSALSTSVSGCGVPEVQQQLDALAAAVRWANISTTGFDHGVQVLVGAADLWDDLEQLATAVEGGDPTAIGQALGAVLDQWTAVSGGCHDSKACALVDGLLRVVQAVAGDVAPCEAALAPALANFTNAQQDWDAKDYKGAVANFAAGLDAVALATAQDSCNLKAVAAAVSGLGPKLAQAVVTVESSEAVKIVVGSADVYSELYAAVQDLKRGDMAGVGVQLGALLAQLRTSGCATKACIVLDGLLSALQIGAADYEACGADVDSAWYDLTYFTRDVHSKDYKSALSHLGQFMAKLANSVTDCGVPDLAKALEDTATRLGDDSLATEIGDVTQALVSGADVTLDLQKVTADFNAQDWAALGGDLGGLSDWIAGTGCHSFVCKLVEGILTEGDKALTQLKPCEADLRQAENAFTAGAALWAQGKPADAVKYWAAGLNQVAGAVGDCGLADQLSYIEQEANVLGFGNVTGLDGVIQVLVHGADFYQELYGAVQAIEQHDYRSAGAEMGKVLDDLSQWTKGHACTSDFCYVVIGALQFLGDIQGDIGACEADFKHSWGNFSAAATDLIDQQHTGIDHLIHFNHDDDHVKQGIKEIGYGFRDIAQGVSDCHL